MPGNTEAIQHCKERLLEAFVNYDLNVDIVSCWQSFLDFKMKDQIEFFDRFPEMPPTNVTPDFTVLFKKKYGIIAEIKRTFPQADNAFEGVMSQIKGYDDELDFQTSTNGQFEKPDKHDIMVILFSPSGSFEIANRINILINNKNKPFQFNNCLVAIEVIYSQTDQKNRYVFRRLPQIDTKFRDDCLSEAKRLEHLLEGGKSIEVYPKHIMEYKIRWKFCNDDPPEIYTAVFLWLDVFFDYVTEEQLLNWRVTPQSSIEIQINIDELVDRIKSKILPSNGIRKSWITDAIDFLCTANLAQRIDGNNVLIKYRNLVSKAGLVDETENSAGRSPRMRDYGIMMADLYCSGKFKKAPQVKKRRTKKITKQKTLY